MPCCASQPHGPCVGKSTRLVRAVNRRAPANQILVRAEIPAVLSWEHVVGERIAFRHRPVRLDLRRVNVLIRASPACFTVDVDGAEAVHLTLVVIYLECRTAVLIELRAIQVARFQWDRLSTGHLADRRTVCPRERCEEVVETAIGLNHDHDIADSVRGRRRVFANVGRGQRGVSNAMRTHAAAAGERSRNENAKGKAESSHDAPIRAGPEGPPSSISANRQK